MKHDSIDQDIESDLESELSTEDLCLTITLEDREQFKRLDQYLSHIIKDRSRTFIKNLFEQEYIFLSPDNLIHGQKLELKKMPEAGTHIVVQLPPPMPSTCTPENIPLEILFEDEHLLIINKQAGIVTHPAPGNYTGTLVNAILFHCRDLSGVGDQKRPGIVHRLDKGTSGIMVVAKSHACHEGLVQLFSKHDIERKYEAIAIGALTKKEGIITSTIGRDPHNRLKMKAHVKHGKNATTHFSTITNFGIFQHLEFKLETGRTHQIRVHAQEFLKCPLLCDYTYGNVPDQFLRLSKNLQALVAEYPYPFLHAKILGFIHPITKEKLHFEVEPPTIFKNFLNLAREEFTP